VEEAWDGVCQCWMPTGCRSDDLTCETRGSAGLRMQLKACPEFWWLKIAT
jgi:hypothetical protein